MSVGSRRAERRRARQLVAQLPLAASTVARSVHSGATLLGALEEASSSLDDPTGAALAEVVSAVRRGVAVDQALSGWAEQEQLDEVTLLASAARLGHRHGGDLAVALDAVSVSLLDRIEVADEARALTSQARSSAAVLVALPPFGAACFCLLDPAVATTLLTTPVGWTCLVAGGLLDLAGAGLLRRLVAGALR